MATLSWLLDVNAPNAAKTFDQISLRMKDLDANLKKTREVAVGDRDAMAVFAKLQLQADKFGDKIHNMPLTLEGAAKAEAQLLALEATADRLDKKLGSEKVDTSSKGGILSRIRGLFGGSGGTGPSLFSSDLGGLAGLGGGGGGGAGLALGPIGIGGAIAAALALAPAAIPFGLGGLTGLGAAGGAYMLGSKANQKIQKLSLGLATATGKKRQDILSQIASIRKTDAPELKVYGGVQDVGQSALGAFSGALTAGGSHSFVSGLAPILKQISGFIKGEGPQLGQLFRASLPFVSSFVKIMEQFAKAVLPSVTQSLKIMRPDLPIIVQGFKLLSQGIAGFIMDLGPGIKDSAIIFKAMMMVVKGVLQLVGEAASAFAIVIVKMAEGVRTAARDIPRFFDAMRHEVASIFDDIERFIEIWALRIELVLAGWAKNVLHYAQDAFGWLPGWLPGVKGIKEGLANAQSDLGSFVSSTQNQLAKLTTKQYPLKFTVHLPPGAVTNTPGAKSGGAPTRPGFAGGTSGAPPGWAWVGERGKELVRMTGGETVLTHQQSMAVSRGFADGTGMLTVHMSTPSVKAIGSTMGSIVGNAVKAVRSHYIVHASMPLAVGGPDGHGAIGGGVQRWAGLAAQVLRMLGQPAGDLGTVLSQMTTESGGNPYAINLWDSNAAAGDPSRGLMQVIGTTFSAYAGPYIGRGIYDPLANIYAGLNYAIHRYGAGWTSVLGHGHGYANGGIITEPIFGVGRSGQAYTFGERGDETVTPGRHSPGRGPLVNIEHYHQNDGTSAAMLAQKLSFAVVAAGLGS